MSRSHALVVVVCGLVGAGDVVAQQVPPYVLPVTPAQAMRLRYAQGVVAPTQEDVIPLVLGGVVAGTVGLGLGYGIGSLSHGGPTSVIGLGLAEVTLLPLGVHVANHGRGNYALDLLASAAFGAACAAMAYGFGNGETTHVVAYISLGVIGQLISSIVMERATERQRHPEPP